MIYVLIRIHPDYVTIDRLAQFFNSVAESYFQLPNNKKGLLDFNLIFNNNDPHGFISKNHGLFNEFNFRLDNRVTLHAFHGSVLASMNYSIKCIEKQNKINSGDYILVLDCDDKIEVDYFKNLLNSNYRDFKYNKLGLKIFNPTENKFIKDEFPLRDKFDHAYTSHFMNCVIDFNLFSYGIDKIKDLPLHRGEDVIFGMVIHSKFEKINNIESCKYIYIKDFKVGQVKDSHKMMELLYSSLVTAINNYIEKDALLDFVIYNPKVFVELRTWCYLNDIKLPEKLESLLNKFKNFYMEYLGNENNI